MLVGSSNHEDESKTSELLQDYTSTDLELNNAESTVESNSQLNTENHMPEEEGVTGVKT